MATNHKDRIEKIWNDSFNTINERVDSIDIMLAAYHVRRVVWVDDMGITTAILDQVEFP